MITDFSCWVDVDIARFQKYKKNNKKNQNLQKKRGKEKERKSWGTSLKTLQNFSYKYHATLNFYVGGNFAIWVEATQNTKKTLKS